MHPRGQQRVTWLPAFLFVASALLASAADRLWVGGSDGQWGTAANWNAAAVPGASDRAIFSNSLGQATVLITANSSPRLIQWFIFRTNANAYTIQNGGGSNGDRLQVSNGGGVDVNAGVSADLDFSGLSYFRPAASSTLTLRNNGAGLLKLPNSVSGFGGGAVNLIFDGTGIVVAKTLDLASGYLRLEGAGTVQVTDSGNGTGGIILRNGVLEAGAVANSGTASPLGSSGNIDFGDSTVTNAVATLRFTGGSASCNRSFRLRDNSQAVFEITNVGSTLSLSSAVVQSAGAGGRLTKTGPGTLALGGANNYSGLTTVSGGKLEISTAHAGGGGFSVSDGAGLKVSQSGLGDTLEMSSLSLGIASGVTMELLNTTSVSTVPLISVTNLTVNGVITVNISGLLTVGQQLPLIGFTNRFGSGLFVLGSLPGGVSGNLATNGNTILLNVTSGLSPLVWSGLAGSLVNSNWDIELTANWRSNGIPAVYQDGLLAILNDSAGSATLNLTTNVSPIGLVVSNNVLDFTLAGVGKLSGGMSLSKVGGAVLTLTTANDYTGGTSISRGTLRVSSLANGGSVSSIGASASNAANLAFDGGTLEYLGYSASINRGATLGAGSGTIRLVQPGTTLTVSGSFVGSGGLTKTGPAALVMNGNSTFTGTTTVLEGTLGGVGALTGAVVMQNNTILAPGAGAFAMGNLTLGSQTTLQMSLGAPGSSANSTVAVNGNLTLAGQLVVDDAGGMVAGSPYTAIYYTGTLTNLGFTNAPHSDWNVTIDTSTPHYVKVVPVSLRAPIELAGGDRLITDALTTNLTAYIHTPVAEPIWYEVWTGETDRRLVDFGTHMPSNPWTFKVRHLGAGTNYLAIFAKLVGGQIISNVNTLTLVLGTNPSVRPRPVPADVVWGGLTLNMELTDPAKPWELARRYSDGIILRNNSPVDLRSLAEAVRPYNGLFWMEVGAGGADPADPSWAGATSANWISVINNREPYGIAITEAIFDYHIDEFVNVCRAHPDWATNDLVAWWTGDLSVANPGFPPSSTTYSSGLFGPIYQNYYNSLPHIKLSMYSHPRAWRWDNYLANGSDVLAFNPLTDTGGMPMQVNGTNVVMSFNAKDLFASHMNSTVALGHPFYAHSTDCPWPYWQSDYGWVSASDAANTRAKARAYERYYQGRGGRHNLDCSTYQAGAQPGGDIAQDTWYRDKSLEMMFTHQAEGGRANVYLYQSWLSDIPHHSAPEDQPGTFANQALCAIKYLKGIRSADGALQQLTMAVTSSGMVTTLSVTNDGDYQCMPAITASESGDASVATRYYNQAGRDITLEIQSIEGYIHTNRLQPGQSFSITCQVAVPNGTPGAVTKSATLEAFWNPQDPTGVVRDRKFISWTAADLPTLTPRAWYRFEGNALDSSGNNFNGTNSGGVAYTLGKEGAQAAQFNGTSAYVQVPRSIGTNFTIAFWLKTAATAANGQWWAGKGLVDGEIDGTTNDFGTAILADKVGFGVGNPDTTIVSTQGVSDNQWHHVVATRDSTNGAINLYVDGALQASATGPTGPRTAPPILRIGGLQTGATFFNGLIDDVQLYDRVLNGAEAAWLAGAFNRAPLLVAVSNVSLPAGRTLVVTNVASDPDAPPQTLTFSLASAPVGATIQPNNGVLTWRPSIAQSGTSNHFAVVVTDNAAPNLSAAQGFGVNVLPPASPVISGAGFSNGQFTMQVNGDFGPDYLIETATNLGAGALWLPLLTNVSPSVPFSWADSGATNATKRFYRVRLGP